MNDYLWDREGTDEEIERLERILRPAGFSPLRSPSPLPRKWAPARTLAASFSFAALLLFSTVLFLNLDPVEPVGYSVTEAGRTYPLAPGTRIEARRTPSRISLGDVGEMTLMPDSLLRILQVDAELHKLRLERGSLQAFISASARPRLVQVETPSTTCVDLGCVYRLSVDEDGTSVVEVLLGRVAFVDGSREVFVPSGARCRALRDRPVRVPISEDAPAPFREAVERFETSRPEERIEAGRALAQRLTRMRDTLTVWHLLQEAQPEIAAAAYEALAKLTAIPPGVTREASLRGDPGALNRWKEHLARGW